MPSSLSEQTAGRLQAVYVTFNKAFGHDPAVVARAPGRVNLIGEHIDYMDFGVLPMAIEQDCLVALAPAKDAKKIHLTSTNPTSYEFLETDLSSLVEKGIPSALHSWGNYFLAAFKGVIDHCQQKGVPHHKLVEHGLQVAVDGTVPAGAGLSSSSALVVASVLALVTLYDLAATPTEIADVCIRCEKYVGTEGGGMDQSVSMLAQEGLALYVRFNPLNAQPVQLPAGATFVIANSLVESKKAETAAKQYNVRVLECKLAVILLASSMGLHAGKCLEVKTLAEVHRLWIETQPGRATGDIASSAWMEVVAAALHDEPYSWEEVEAILGSTLQQLLDRYPRLASAASACRADATTLKLRQRAVHVYSEAQRVLDFVSLCQSVDTSPADKLYKAGRLMTASHASCRDTYECSCPELDALVEFAKDGGALGARLTGAGWGGCVVCLVKADDAETLCNHLRQVYYQPLIDSGSLKEARLSEALFVTAPGGGARVLEHAA